MRVHLLDIPDPDALRLLRAELLPTITLSFGQGDVPPDCEVLVCGRPNRAQLTASRDLRVLVIPFAGVPPQTRSTCLHCLPPRERETRAP